MMGQVETSAVKSESPTTKTQLLDFIQDEAYKMTKKIADCEEKAFKMNPKTAELSNKKTASDGKDGKAAVGAVAKSADNIAKDVAEEDEDSCKGLDSV